MCEFKKLEGKIIHDSVKYGKHYTVTAFQQEIHTNFWFEHLVGIGSLRDRGLRMFLI